MDRIERQARELGDSLLAERQQMSSERRRHVGVMFGCFLCLAGAAFILWAGYHAG